MGKNKKKKSFGKNRGIDKAKNNDDKKRKKENINKEFFFPKYLNKIYEENKFKIENYNLNLNKFVIGKFEKGELKLKIENLGNTITDFGESRFNLIKKFIEKYNSSINNLNNKTHIIKEIIFEPDYKLIIGLGNPSVYDVSITLHYIYGFPYIPAQAIKGVLRNYVINEYFDLSEDERNNLEDDKKITEKKEKKALENQLFKFIFGSNDNQGNIIFFDALPINNINIELDIMNNHFPEYYEDNENQTPPADYQNPRPIKFLTVKNAKFKFFIGIRNNIKPINLKKFDSDEKIRNKEQILDYVIKLLKEALEFNGIGAKTSVGYGSLILKD